MALTKADVVAQIADRTGLTKVDSEAALNAFSEVLVDALALGEDVKWTGIFTVERVERAARFGRDPLTGEPLSIPAKSGVKLTAGALLKKAVSNPLPSFENISLWGQDLTALERYVLGQTPVYEGRKFTSTTFREAMRAIPALTKLAEKMVYGEIFVKKVTRDWVEAIFESKAEMYQTNSDLRYEQHMKDLESWNEQEYESQRRSLDGQPVEWCSPAEYLELVGKLKIDPVNGGHIQFPIALESWEIPRDPKHRLFWSSPGDYDAGSLRLVCSCGNFVRRYRPAVGHHVFGLYLCGTNCSLSKSWASHVDNSESQVNSVYHGGLPSLGRR